jgi:hypothetical protein
MTDFLASACLYAHATGRILGWVFLVPILSSIPTFVRRSFPRYQVEVPFRAMAQRLQGDAVLLGHTLNFCEGGLGAMIEGELSPGEFVSLRVKIPQCAVPIQIRATVRYRQGRIYGFQFVDLGALQLAEIRACCRRLAETDG